MNNMFFGLYKVEVGQKTLDSKTHYDIINKEYQATPHYVLAKSFEEAFNELKEMNLKYHDVLNIKQIANNVILNHHKIFADKLEEALNQENKIQLDTY